MDILINNIPLELAAVPVEIDLSNMEFDGESTIKAYKTNKINVPATPANTALLTRLQELNSGGYSPLLASIRGNGVEFTGRVKLYPATTVRGVSVLPIQIISGNGDWVKELEDETLNSCDLSDSNHVFNRDNVVASVNRANSGNINYIYDLCDRGDGLTPGEWELPERYPAIRLTYLLTRIFREKGIRVTSNTLADGFINRLFLLFTQPDDRGNIEGWNQEMFLANGIPTPYNPNAAIGTSQFGGVTWYMPSPGVYATYLFNCNYQTASQNDGDHYIPTTGAYVVNDNQVCGTKLKGSLRYKIDRADTTSTFYLYVTLQIYSGSYYGTLVAESTARFNPSPTSYYTQTVETDWFRPVAGTSYFLTLKYYGLLSTGTKLKLIIDQSTPEANYFRNYTKNWYVPGDTVNLADTLPKGKTKLEFIKDMASTFDLMFDYCPDSRTMRIENRAKFFDTLYRDLPGTIDADSEITIDHTIEDVGRAIQFSTIEDTGDQTPGSRKLSEPLTQRIDNPYGYNPTTQRRRMMWADTVQMHQSRLGLKTKKIPTLWKDGAPTLEDGKQVFSKFATEFTTRVMRLVGTQIEPTGYVYDNTTYTLLPNMISVTAPEIVDRYWQGRLWQYRNAKRLTVTALLPGNVINRLINSQTGYSMRTPWQVTIPKLAHGIFMIEKIEGYTMDTPGLCTVRLVELPPAYREPAVSTNPIVEFTLINGGQLNINEDGGGLSLDQPCEDPLEPEVIPI